MLGFELVAFEGVPFGIVVCLVTLRERFICGGRVYGISLTKLFCGIRVVPFGVSGFMFSSKGLHLLVDSLVLIVRRYCCVLSEYRLGVCFPTYIWQISSKMQLTLESAVTVEQRKVTILEPVVKHSIVTSHNNEVLDSILIVQSNPPEALNIVNRYCHRRAKTFLCHQQQKPAIDSKKAASNAGSNVSMEVSVPASVAAHDLIDSEIFVSTSYGTTDTNVSVTFLRSSDSLMPQRQFLERR